MKSLQELYDDYVEYRAVSGLKTSTLKSLTLFVHSLQKEHGHEVQLTQVYFDNWYKRRETEKPNSYRARTLPVKTFVEFANLRGLSQLELPSDSAFDKTRVLPHIFIDEELFKFFKACDELETGCQLSSKLNRIEIPVFYRLLYSSGLRLPEVRFLLKKDVNLKDGIIEVRRTKGYNEHRVVLHDSMVELLSLYDSKVELLMPGRKVFFPNRKDQYHCAQWVNIHFKELWSKYNTSKCLAYAFRHNYAIANINSWHSLGYGISFRLAALSRSMGHTSLRSTLYYFHLVPWFDEIISNLEGTNLESLIPNLPENEQG